MREMDRSSTGVREDEKMERSTVGVTGIREFDAGCWSCGVLLDLGTAVDELDVDELGMLVDLAWFTSNFSFLYICFRRLLRRPACRLQCVCLLHSCAISYLSQ